MIHDLIRHNQFVKGEFKLGVHYRPREHHMLRARVSRVSQGVICRVSQAEAVMRLVNSRDDEFCVLDGGHISMMTGAEARQGLWLKVHRWF